jgi:hypothetical protein
MLEVYGLLIGTTLAHPSGPAGIRAHYMKDPGTVIADPGLHPAQYAHWQ